MEAKCHENKCLLVPSKVLFGLLATLSILKHKIKKYILNSILSLGLNLNFLGGGIDVLIKERRRNFDGRDLGLLDGDRSVAGGPFGSQSIIWLKGVSLNRGGRSVFEQRREESRCVGQCNVSDVTSK